MSGHIIKLVRAYSFPKHKTGTKQKRDRSYVTTKFVALILACIADQHGKNIYPSLATIAKETGLDIRAVRRAIRELEDLAIIRRIKESKGRTTNLYEFTTEWIEQQANNHQQPQPTASKAYSPWNIEKTLQQTTTPQTRPQTPQPEPPRNGFTQVHEGVRKALDQAILLRKKATKEPLQ